LKNLKNDINIIFGDFKNAGTMPHFHETYSIGFFTKGGCRYKIGSKENIVNAGDIRIIPPFELHKTYEGEWQYLHVDLKPELILNFLQSVESNTDFLSYKLINDQTLFHYGFSLYKNMNNPLEFEESLLYFCERIYKNYFNSFCILDYSKSKLSNAIEYIFTYWNRNDLTVETLAKNCNLSLYHFTRNFSRIYGITPHKFIMSLRVEKAKEKILNTNLPMSFIAYECGFSDQSHMIKIFKKILGYKPGILRG